MNYIWISVDISLFTVDFWLDGRKDPTCVDLGNCRSSDIVWEDGGPAFDESLYDGWLYMNIDSDVHNCIKASTTHFFLKKWVTVTINSCLIQIKLENHEILSFIQTVLIFENRSCLLY